MVALMFILRSSAKPVKKINVQKVKYSKKVISLELPSRILKIFSDAT